MGRTAETYQWMWEHNGILSFAFIWTSRIWVLLSKQSSAASLSHPEKCDIADICKADMFEEWTSNTYEFIHILKWSSKMFMSPNHNNISTHLSSFLGLDKTPTSSQSFIAFSQTASSQRQRSQKSQGPIAHPRGCNVHHIIEAKVK